MIPGAEPQSTKSGIHQNRDRFKGSKNMAATPISPAISGTHDGASTPRTWRCQKTRQFKTVSHKKPKQQRHPSIQRMSSIMLPAGNVFSLSKKPFPPTINAPSLRPLHIALRNALKRPEERGKGSVRACVQNRFEAGSFPVGGRSKRRNGSADVAAISHLQMRSEPFVTHHGLALDQPRQGLFAHVRLLERCHCWDRQPETLQTGRQQPGGMLFVVTAQAFRAIRDPFAPTTSPAAQSMSRSRKLSLPRYHPRWSFRHSAASSALASRSRTSRVRLAIHAR